MSVSPFGKNDFVAGSSRPATKSSQVSEWNVVVDLSVEVSVAFVGRGDFVPAACHRHPAPGDRLRQLRRGRRRGGLSPEPATPEVIANSPRE